MHHFMDSKKTRSTLAEQKMRKVALGRQMRVDAILTLVLRRDLHDGDADPITLTSR